MFDLKFYNEKNYENKDPKILFEEYKKECIRLYKDSKSTKLTYNDFLLANRQIRKRYNFESMNTPDFKL